MNQFLLTFILVILCVCCQSQNKEGVAVNGTVYCSSSRSQGVMNGKTFYEGEGFFRNQNLYFFHDSVNIVTKTDSSGVFHVVLRPGIYNVNREEYLNGAYKGMNTYLGDVVTVTEMGGTFTVHLRTHVNGRSAMNPKGYPIPGSVKKTKYMKNK